MQAAAKACRSLSGRLEEVHYEANDLHNHHGAGRTQNASPGHAEVEREEAEQVRLEGVDLDEHGKRGLQNAGRTLDPDRRGR